MKRIYILLLFVFLSAGALQAQWRELHTGVTENLYDVCCVDTNTVFVCGQNGVILKTEDGGDTWQELYRQEGRELCKIAFANQNVGYVGGNDGADNGILMRTTDGGETWEDVNNTIVFKNDHHNYVSDTYDGLFSCQNNLCITSSDTIFVYKQNTLFISTDFGENFSSQTFQEGKINGVFFESDYGCAVLYDREASRVWIKKTDDFGSSWEGTTDFEFQGSFYADGHVHGNDFFVLFTDKEHIRIICNYMILETSDGFSTFTESYPIVEGLMASNYGPFDMDFSGNSGCFVYNFEMDKEYKEVDGNPYQICGAGITWDGGDTWTTNEPGIYHQYNYYYSVSAVDRMFYVSSEKGKVYHYSEYNFQGVNEEKTNADAVKIFPNPTHDRITIEGKEIKKVEIFDLVGREIISQTYNTSNDKIEMDLSDVQEGLYIIKVYDKNGCNELKINKIR